MGLRERIADWIAPRRSQRVFIEPQQLVPPYSSVFGPGLSNQAPHEDLLRANTGVADMATRAIANRVSMLDLEVYTVERVEDGTTTDVVLDDHILNALLADPNPNYTIDQMLRVTAQYVVTVGEGYWLKVRNSFGRSAQLDILPASRVRPLVERNQIVAYNFHDGFGEWQVLPADAVVRFWFPDPESLFESEGYLGPNANAHNALSYQEQHVARHYEADAMPPAWLQQRTDAATVPGEKEQERWLNQFLKRFSQREGTDPRTPAWAPPGWEIVMAAAESGADITPLLAHFQDNQLMNFGVPRSVLGQVVSGDRSSAETNNFVFDDKTVSPITNMIGNALTKSLATEFDPMLKVRFKSFVAPNREQDRQDQAHRLSLKLTTINEERVEVEGKDPVDYGDLPVGQIAEVPYTGDTDRFGTAPVPAEVEPEPEPMDDEDAEPEEPRKRSAAERREAMRQSFGMRALLYEELFGEQFMRAMRRIFRAQERKTLGRYAAYAKGNDGRKRQQQRPDPAAFESKDEFMAACVPQVIAEGKSQAQAVGQCNGMWEGRVRSHMRVNADDLFSPSEWFELFKRVLEPIVTSIWVRVGSQTLENVAGTAPSFIFNDTAVSNVQEGIRELAESTGNTTYTQLTSAIEQGIENGESVTQISKRIRGVFAFASDSRARTIARTEVLRATQSAQQEGFSQSGVVTHKQWNTSLDGRVRDTHVPLEGATVELNEDFSVGGEPARGPGDPRLSAGNVINCRCFLSPVLAGEVDE